MAGLLLEPAVVADLHERLLSWYDRSARDLPWRAVEATPWAVLVSEFMLQQTPVARVLPVWSTWLARWPTPADLAASPRGEAVRAWGRLGYPRRALRLHEAAQQITREHDGRVPEQLDELRRLPGVGDYTAAAVASFAFHQRHAVLDTNVRRVFARLLAGSEFPPVSVTRSERAAAAALLPRDPRSASRWAIATMELGALVCQAAAPRCEACPVADVCRWRIVGFPAYAGPKRRGQAWEGTDRQCRGRLLAVLRETPGGVPHQVLAAAWPDPVQRERALDSLVADGLVQALAGDRFTLPT